jgi:Leucine-rich repeat (LRR) protein
MPAMSGCVALTSIDLNSNTLTAEGLEPFCSNPPPNLAKLQMRRCGLQGTYLGQPVVLAHINGSLFPHVREELPATIGNLQALEYLHVAANRLSGTCLVEPVDLAHIGGSLLPHAHEELPATIGNLQALEYLNVESNRLSGTCLVEPVRPLTHILVLPETIGQLASLKELNCSLNAIEGTIYF